MVPSPRVTRRPPAGMSDVARGHHERHERLAELDERLRAATVPDSDHRLAEFFAVRAGWWWHRVARTLIGDLARSLREA